MRSSPPTRCSRAAPRPSPLRARRPGADANGLQLPAGFTSRIVARSNQSSAGTTYKWHRAPDGGRVFADVCNGWAYVSNAELATAAAASA